MEYQDDLTILCDLVETAYHDLKTETVPVEPPPPTTVEMRTETLDAATGEPIEKKFAVTLSADDYPAKTVEVRHYKRVQRTVTEEVDRGPKPEFKIAAYVGYASAILFFLGTLILSPASVPGYVMAVIAAGLGYLAGEYLRKNRREIETVERVEWDWEPQMAEVQVPVPDRFAPRTEERLVPNPECILSLGKISFELRAVATAEGSLVVVPDGLGDPLTLEYPALEDASELALLRDRLEALADELPIVLSGARGDVSTDDPETTFRHGVPLRGEEIELHDVLSEIDRLFRSSSHEHLNLSVLSGNNPLVGLLEPTDQDSSRGEEESEEALRSLVESAVVESVASLSAELLDTWSRNTLILALIRSTALNDLISPTVNELGYVSHYSSFNFYCPHCTASSIRKLADRDYTINADTDDEPIYFSPDSRCHYDPDQREWVCQGCERTVERPIPVHKLLDDVLFPAYDRLIDEHREDRLALDNGSSDDATDYRNRWNQEVERIEARFQSDTAESRSSMEEIEAEIEGDLQAIEGLQEVMKRYKLQQSEALGEITERCQSTHDEVAASVSELIAQADERFHGQMAVYRREMDALAVSKRRETVLRDAIQIEALRRLGRIADSSEETAANTGAIKESSRQTVAHLENIEASSAKTAGHMERVEANTAKGAAHLETIDASTAKSAAHLEGIEKTNAKALDKLDGVTAGIKEGNAIAAARAEREGQDVYRHSPFRVDKRLKEGLADAISTVTGSSDVEKHRRRSEYLN